jgi:PPOX class probable F420-dependent enzyme
VTATIPPEFEDLVGPPTVALLATTNADGTLQVTPVWATRDGGTLIVGSAKGRAKDRNMRARAEVALAFVDPANPYRYVSVSGTVSFVRDEDDPEHAEAVTGHIDAAAQAYVGQSPYPFRQPGEVRTMFGIEPLRVHTYG